jgi:hypothetical protein
MKNPLPKYTFKEKLEIAESVITIITFLMAIWGSVIAYEHNFWSKLNHVVDHYHSQIQKQERQLTLKIDNLKNKAHKF